MVTSDEVRENDLIREIIRLKSFVHRTFCEQGHHHRNCKSAHRLINSDDFRDQTAMIFEDIAVRKEEHRRALESGEARIADGGAFVDDQVSHIRLSENKDN